MSKIYQAANPGEGRLEITEDLNEHGETIYQVNGKTFLDRQLAIDAARGIAPEAELGAAVSQNKEAVLVEPYLLAESSSEQQDIEQESSLAGGPS